MIQLTLSLSSCLRIIPTLEALPMALLPPPAQGSPPSLPLESS